MHPSPHRSVPLLALVGALLLPLAASAQTPPVRIMPLGDSITYGSVPGGYRNKLYQTLTTAGYNVDFVGTQTANGVATLPDSDHEGHSRWIIGQLDANIAGWFGAIADPDVILLHIGTNDFGLNVDTPNAINRLDALITKMAALRPYAHIIVTNLMERNEPQNTTIQAQFNPYVQARVNAQAALGRRVTFLDMRSAVPLAEMPDQLHPGQAGYDHMADAWLPAIQAIIGPQGDGAVPAIVRAVGNADRTHVAITFSKPVANSAATVGNFALSGGLTVAAAVLDASKRTVTLTTSLQTLAASYTATVNGVVDRTAGALSLPANSTVNFNGATPRGYLNNVPESAGYTLAYSLDIPVVGNYGAGAVPYAVDNRNGLGPFTRVAYYLELQTASGDLQYVWASVDAFTTDVGKIAVPTLASGAVFQQGVTGMNVVSNVPGISTGTGLAGNLEFWPVNYATANSAGVAGASDTLYDFGDQPAAGNYGSMQLHNTGAGQTVFGFNNWGGTATALNLDLGIGNNPAPVNGGVDWTFANNAGNYTIKTLQVLVQTSGDTTRPTLAAATASFGRTQLTVRFSEPLAGASVLAQNFALNGGVIVLGATLAPNQRDVQLLTTTQPAGTPLTLTVSGVRDSSPNANLIVPGSSIAGGAATLPPEIVANVGAAASGYQLVASIDLPVTGNFNASSSAYTFDERAAAGTFTRVAYYLELQQPGGPVQYAWAAMNAFTTNKQLLGIPTVASGATFQQNVTNLSVLSNVAGVVNGTTASGGNIEFWPGNYAQANALGVPNASAATFDFGDTLAAGAGYGSMQIHNHDAAAAQTVLAVNDFGTDGGTLDVGIGNDAAPVNTGVDWTFAANAGSYTRRILHILVLPDGGQSGTPDTTGPVIVSAKGSATLNRLIVAFDEVVADTAAVAANFNIPGLSITGATLLSGQKEIVLTTGAQTPGAVYTVNVSGVRDRSPAGNLILPGAAAAFTAFTTPAILANVPETSGYKLIYKLAIPSATPLWNVNAIPYSVEEARYGGQLFDRVAYLLELGGNWVYASFDRHTAQLSQTGVPTLGVTAAAFQQNVAHMNVASNVAGIVTGTDLAGGNIEFWGGNYSPANALGIANASDTLFDFGDTMSGGGYGCMQVHNHNAQQTLFAYNNWGSNNGGNSDLGIGSNATGGQPDWTFAANAAAAATRNLYVLVRPGGTASGAAPALLSQPTARLLNPGGSTTLAVSVYGPGPFTYQWRLNGVAIAGATNPWLDLGTVGFAQAGAYDVVVTGANLVSTASQPAVLTVNHAPTFGGFTFTTQKDTPDLLPRAALVAKGADLDGHPLTLSAASPASAQGGTVSLAAAGATYTPALGFLGADSFAVTITDGFGGSVVGTVKATVTAAPLSSAGQSSLALRPDGKVDLLFYGTPGQSYAIQQSIDLRNPLGWITLLTLGAGDDGRIPFTDPAPPMGEAFYRTFTTPP